MSAESTLIIQKNSSYKNYWGDLWSYRELFIILALRDISVRYKQTLIGVMWALIRPFLTIVVFTVIFGSIAALPADGGVPYSLFVAVGLLPWFFFSNALSDMASSLVANGNLISKVYFPRLIIPVSTMVVSLIDFFISFLIVIALFIWFQIVPGWQIIFLPFFICMAILTSLGPGILLASMNVKYRDFRYVLPFIVQFGLYVSPVGFIASLIPEKWRMLYAMNPMVSVIDGFRWTLFGGELNIDPKSFLISWLIIILFLWLGIKQFRRVEKSFADLI